MGISHSAETTAGTGHGGRATPGTPGNGTPAHGGPPHGASPAGAPSPRSVSRAGAAPSPSPNASQEKSPVSTAAIAEIASSAYASPM
ncbi:hypothetical protein C1J01_06055 [Nonomuraea aridisoli]|uniref:Uncharacterized protein n=1 Tax=Nonomuraea aridisoli TaxID=2070368 RepID=A0A2W2F9M8_9ACTN|nr:hypothetical protein C1J01_06055 [Nonomuraea aridisoli]